MDERRMCGIAGFAEFQEVSQPALEQRARAMADSLVHRGPDDGGVWADAAGGYATGHRRLAIIDLSEAGAQPMASACGRFVISYNGEVYNAPEVRAELEPRGYRFRGHSDTEVILEACAEWGVEKAIPRFIGMFALALWDRRDKRLWLVRDRLGIKPLYWAKFGNLVLFASELKALRAHDGWPVEIDRSAVSAYLRFGYIPAPLSIYQGVSKLEPGTILTVSRGAPPKILPFWSPGDAIAAARRVPFPGDDREAVDCLHDLLGDSIRRRMIADVPFGAFLSGGIDSSLVVALMQECSSQPVKTFSIGFHEDGYDEARHAAAVARHLGTDHTEFYVTSDEARDVIPRLPAIYDEPFADSSQIPTFLVSEITRRHVTVALSGDGGDELFCGYTRYFHAAGIEPRIAAIPAPLRRLAGAVIGPVPGRAWEMAARMVPGRWRPRGVAGKAVRFREMLMRDDDQLYLQMLSHWHDPEALSGVPEPHTVITDRQIKAHVPDYQPRLQYIDTLTYLPDDILTKVDRASMAVSLEVRVPMIDHRVFEFSWSLPRHMQVRDGQGKWILRELLGRYVPRELFERPKMGFGIPIGDWMRGPLRPWAEDLLSEDALCRNGLNPALIRERWSRHCDGRENWQYPLWTILTLQAWLEENR
jgi:asparagine synthase (glutamine-hydrolysing)